MVASIKYLGVFLDDSLTWNTHPTNLISKRNRAISLQAKIHHCTPKSLLKLKYSLFNSYMAAKYRGKQNLQEKAIYMIKFLPNTTLVNKIYENSKILQLSDYVSLHNFLLVKDCFDAILPETLNK